MSTETNTQVVLAPRPQGYPQPPDFDVVNTPLLPLKDGEARVRNLVLSMDAGFRHWMDAGSGDDYLPEMPLGAAVMGLTVGEIVESRHQTWRVGDHVMGRLAWERFSTIGTQRGDEFLTRVPDNPAFPLRCYLGILGGTGMTAYFGVTDICQPRPDDVFVVSAAAGAVGNVAGQIARLRGARVIGITGTDAKCEGLMDLGFDAAVNHRDPGGLDQALSAVLDNDDGIDAYFDNVGGSTLNTVLRKLNTHARVALCGAIASYGVRDTPGPSNMFEMVTRRVRLQGFMYTDMIERYDEASRQLTTWLRDGQLTNAEYVLHGIENAGNAFCDMFAGKNFGKTVVEL